VVDDPGCAGSARLIVQTSSSREIQDVSQHNQTNLSRRTFVCGSGILAGGMMVAGRGSGAEPETAVAPQAAKELPQRVLGRTNVPVTTMTLGTAPCGLCPDIPQSDIVRIVNEALDLGITAVDTAPAYKKAEEPVGTALGKRRKEVFLSTKVLAETIAEAEKSLSSSLKLLKTDCVDLVYFHSVGDCDVEKSLADDGVFPWLLKQKQAGKFRFLGISGHNRPAKFVPFLETDEVDVLLTLVNFVDRFTYAFEDKVLPVARKHNVGIVAMKVFGGARKSAGSYENAQAPPELDVEHLQTAVRYALNTPGVATANLGAHNLAQVRQNVELVRNFTPLTDDEMAQLTRLGQRLAGQWGPHFGSVT
jgi:predicted aldo/keto reductase-like oxidoreductase